MDSIISLKEPLPTLNFPEDSIIDNTGPHGSQIDTIHCQLEAIEPELRTEPIPRRANRIRISNTEHQTGYQTETSTKANQKSNEDPQNLNLTTSNIEPLNTTSANESVLESDENPLPSSISEELERKPKEELEHEAPREKSNNEH